MTCATPDFSARAMRKSSFFWPVRLMPAPRREALLCLYGFCRAVDDIADTPAPAQQQMQALAQWQDYIDACAQAAPPQGLESLADAMADYRLEPAHFHAILDGMRMDVNGDMLRPSLPELERYCYRVAGCVGLLAIRIFGCEHPDSERFAITLGHALQLTNIVRDVSEDARMGRIYLPQEWLQDIGLDRLNPTDMDAQREALRPVLARLSERAGQHYQTLTPLIAPQDAKALTPALLMRDHYYGLWQRMQADGWRSSTRYRSRWQHKLKLVTSAWRYHRAA